MFDYKGFSQEDLINLCRNKNLLKSSIQLQWTSEIYSIGKCLRFCANLPKDFPLNVSTRHGPGTNLSDKIDEHEINNGAYCHFVSSIRNYDLYKKSCNKLCYHFQYPAITYRRMKGINQSSYAKGTIVYPMHSVNWNKVEMDIDDLCNQLNALPEEFKPICICLHYHDINKGQHEEFIKRGFPVYTAGSPYDDRYIDRFYDILKNFKYSMSNEIGSYIYYSVEMGIPFSIIGKPGKIIIPKDIIINGKVHRPKGEFDVHKNYVYLEEFYNLFKDKSRTEISQEQMEYVSMGLGLDSKLTNKDLRKILILACFDYVKKHKLDIMKNIISYIKKYPLFIFRIQFWKTLLEWLRKI